MFTFLKLTDGTVQTIVTQLPQESGSSIGLMLASCNKQFIVEALFIKAAKLDVGLYVVTGQR
jgi:hypothetical protein